jgi:hypothetical protein
VAHPGSQVSGHHDDLKKTAKIIVKKKLSMKHTVMTLL